MKLVLHVNLCWEGQTPSALPRLPLLNLSKPWSHQTKRRVLLIKGSLGLKCTHHAFLKEAMMLFRWLCSLAFGFIVSQSRAALGGDHLLYSHDFHV